MSTANELVELESESRLLYFKFYEKKRPVTAIEKKSLNFRV